MKDNGQDTNFAIKTAEKTQNDFSVVKFAKKILNIFGKDDSKNFKDKLLNILEEIRGINGLGEVERQIMINSLSFSHLTVEDIMVHRGDIVAIDYKITIDSLEKIISDSKHTRFPVYEGNLDNIIGFIHIKDLVKNISEREVNINKILRPIQSVTLNLPLPKLLVKMRATCAHMALVVDEYGGVDGIVAFEDIIEEIIGKVYDEHDRELESEYILISANNLIKAKARLPLEELEKLFDIEFSEEVLHNIDTVGGLILSIEGRVPVEKELIMYRDILEFEIIEADNRSIKWVKIRKISDNVKSENEQR